jgi:hypothetical protein
MRLRKTIKLINQRAWRQYIHATKLSIKKRKCKVNNVWTKRFGVGKSSWTCLVARSNWKKVFAQKSCKRTAIWGLLHRRLNKSPYYSKFSAQFRRWLCWFSIYQADEKRTKISDLYSMQTNRLKLSRRHLRVTNPLKNLRPKRSRIKWSWYACSGR